MSESHFKKLRSKLDDFDFNKLKRKQTERIIKLLKNKPRYRRFLKKIGSIKTGTMSIRKRRPSKSRKGTKSKGSKRKGSRRRSSKNKTKTSKKTV